MGLFASWPSDAGRPRLRRYGARGVVSFMVAFRPGRSLPRVRPGLSPRLAHDGKPTELRSTRARGRVSQISARRTTDALRRLDIRECARSGVLRPGYACRWIWRRGGKVTGTVNLLALDDRLILSYRHRSIGGEWQDETYPALIARTPCHYGGSRPWFVCPVDGCCRRVAILYGAQIFACRCSHRLAYAGTPEGTADRAARRADRIRDRLG